MNGRESGQTIAGRDWEGLIVVCSANNYDTIRVADQHMADQLARSRPVLFVDPPISHFAKNKDAAPSLQEPRLRMISHNLARFTPVVQPCASRWGMLAMTNQILRFLVRRATNRLGGVDAIVSAWPMHPIFGTCRERIGIYWAQDDFVGGAALLGQRANRLLAWEPRVAATADVIVAANPLVRDHWRNSGLVSHLIPYGVDANAYDSVEACAWPHDVNLPRPIAGFVGQINERMDLALLEAVAARGRSLLIVGPRGRMSEPARWDALVGRPNVAWVGPRPFSELPPYLGAIDVGLVPYGDSPFNRGSFPLKTLEYLAAGRRVVSTDLPGVRWFNTDLVTIASTPRDFADAVDKWLDWPRSTGEISERRAFAARHSWAQRARDMLSLVDGSSAQTASHVLA
jgi:glycosyltransferase involved in cell wall biosynthesis